MRLRVTRLARAAWLLIATVSCDATGDRSPSRDSAGPTVASHPPAVSPDSARIAIAGPTLVVFFEGAYTAADSGGDAAEALGDVQYQLGDARPALDSLGVTVVERYGDHVEYTLDGSARRFDPDPDSGRAAYLFLQPGRPAQVHYGAAPELGLTGEVRRRFQLAPVAGQP